MLTKWRRWNQLKYLQKKDVQNSTYITPYVDLILCQLSFNIHCIGRMAAKIFVFIISRNFKCYVSQNFPRILRNFAKHVIIIRGTFLAILGGLIVSIEHTHTVCNVLVGHSHLIGREGSNFTSVPCPKPPHSPSLQPPPTKKISRKSMILFSRNFAKLREIQTNFVTISCFEKFLKCCFAATLIVGVVCWKHFKVNNSIEFFCVFFFIFLQKNFY